MSVDLHSRWVLEHMASLKTVSERSAYCITLAALARGCEVIFYKSQEEAKSKVKVFKNSVNRPVFFSVSSNGSKRFFQGSCAGNVNIQTALATKDKAQTRGLLIAAGVPVPLGGLATSMNLNVLDQMAAAGVQRVVVKPTQSSLQRGVTVGATLGEARELVIACRGMPCLVEQQIIGEEYRACVVGDDIVFALQLIPQHVVGDGTRSIEELFYIASQLRAVNPFFAKKPYDNDQMDARLKRVGLDKSYIPARGEVVRLTDTTVPTNFDRVPAIERLSKLAKTVCLKAAKTVGSRNAGLDIIVTKDGQPFVLEVNIAHGVGQTCFPNPFGAWNLDVPNKILDEYVPGSRGRTHVVQHFDFFSMTRELFRPDRTSRGVRANDFAAGL